MSAAGSPQTGSHDALMRTVFSVVTNVGVLTALLVYFGWKRSDVQARALGLDETIFALSGRDYVLRSVDALFVPLGVVAAVGLAWLWLDGRLRPRIDDPAVRPYAERGVRLLRWAWLLVPVLGFLVGVVAARLRAQMVSLVVYPASFGVGALLTAYAISLRQHLDAGSDPPDEAGAWRRGIAKGLVVVVVLLSVFWTITNVAIVRGLALADQLERAVDRRPGVVVHSARPLGIQAPGVAEEQVGAEAYRYQGLRLLHHHQGTFLLVHDGWNRDQGVLLVLHDDADLRFEIVTGRTGQG